MPGGKAVFFVQKLGDNRLRNPYRQLISPIIIAFRCQIVNGFIAENDTSKKIMFICTVIPAIVYTGVWLIFQFGYPLTKEKMEPIYTSLRAKHEAEANAQKAE